MGESILWVGRPNTKLLGARSSIPIEKSRLQGNVQLQMSRLIPLFKVVFTGMVALSSGKI